MCKLTRPFGQDERWQPLDVCERSCVPSVYQILILVWCISRSLRFWRQLDRDRRNPPSAAQSPRYPLFPFWGMGSTGALIGSQIEAGVSGVAGSSQISSGSAAPKARAGIWHLFGRMPRCHRAASRPAPRSAGTVRATLEPATRSLPFSFGFHVLVDCASDCGGQIVWRRTALRYVSPP